MKKGRILKIEGTEAVLGFDDGTIFRAQMNNFNYEPRTNDNVQIYGDLDGEYIISKVGFTMPKFEKDSITGGFKGMNLNAEDIAPQDPNKPINKTVYLLACFLGGWLGIHKFLTGRTVQGVVYLLLSLISVSVILSIIEGFMSLNLPTDSQGRFIPRSIF